MLQRAFKLALIGLAFGLIFPFSASAHVTVKPSEAPTASFQTFTVSVPNEKNEATTAVRLLIPSGLEHISPTVKPGWNIAMERDGAGEAAAVKSITWEAGTIPAGFREDFTFSAKLPTQPGQLAWKAYQTYAGGQTVAWDLAEDQQPKKPDGSPDFSRSGPFSTTIIVTKSEQTTASNQAERSAAEAKKVATRAQILGIIGLIMGFVALAHATRKQK